MSLNDNHMLPAKIRNMRQMGDILNAEEIILGELEKIIDGMYERAFILHEETINEKWLEEKLGQVIEGIVEVEKRKNRLHIDISIIIEQLTYTEEKTVIDFLEKWLPAHLAYSVIYGEYFKAQNYMSALWQDDEIMEIRQVDL